MRQDSRQIVWPDSFSKTDWFREDGLAIIRTMQDTLGWRGQPQKYFPY
jgi:hypothetical protein